MPRLGHIWKQSETALPRLLFVSYGAWMSEGRARGSLVSMDNSSKAKEVCNGAEIDADSFPLQRHTIQDLCESFENWDKM